MVSKYGLRLFQNKIIVNSWNVFPEHLERLVRDLGTHGMYCNWAQELAVWTSRKANRNALKLEPLLGKHESGPTISRLLTDLMLIGSAAALLAFLHELFKSELPEKLWKRCRASYSIAVSRLKRVKVSFVNHLLWLWKKHSVEEIVPSHRKRTGGSQAGQQVHKVVLMAPQKVLDITMGTVFENEVNFSTPNFFRDGSNECKHIVMNAQE